MKRILLITGVFSCAFILLSSFSLRENPQDPPRGKKVEKHLKLVTIDEDGKKMELDTIIKGENVIVWNGDTIGDGKELKWISKGDFDMDFDIDVEESADGKVIIMKSGKDGKSMIREFKMDGEHDDNIMMWQGDKGKNEMIIRAPAKPSHSGNIAFFGEKKKGNVIDLSDPGIISYNKKELKNGKEKITIIRNKPLEKDIELHEEIILQGAGNQPMIFHGGQAAKTKTVKVIKDDDGNVTIYEDGKVKDLKAGEGENVFFSEEGNVFHVKTKKEGKEEKIEVEVEMNEEIEKEKK